VELATFIFYPLPVIKKGKKEKKRKDVNCWSGRVLCRTILSLLLPARGKKKRKERKRGGGGGTSFFLISSLLYRGGKRRGGGKEKKHTHQGCALNPSLSNFFIKKGKGKGEDLSLIRGGEEKREKGRKKSKNITSSTPIFSFPFRGKEKKERKRGGEESLRRVILSLPF